MQATPNLGNVVHMSVTICFHISITLSLNTLYPQLADQKGYYNMGQIGMISMFTMQLFANIIGSRIISLQHYGRMFLLSGLLPMTIFIPSFLVNGCKNPTEEWCSPTFITTITVITSGVQGFGFGIYFLVQASYVTACTTEQNRDILFGICYSILGGALLVSSAASNVILGIFERDQFLRIMFVLQCFLGLTFLALPNPAKLEQPYTSVSKEAVEDSTEKGEMSQSVNIVTTESMNKDGRGKKQMNLIDETMKALTDTKLRLLLPFFILTGVVMGFEFGQFYQIIMTCIEPGKSTLEVNQMTFVVFIYLGVGEMVSGPIISALRGNVKLVTYLKLYCVLLAIVIVLSAMNVDVRSYTLSCYLGFFWGCMDNFGQSIGTMVVSEHWPDNLTMLGVYLMVQNLGAALYNVIAIFLPYSYTVHALGIAFAITIASFTGIRSFIKYV